MDRRDVLEDRRAGERRAAPAFRPAGDERRSGRERREDDRRAWNDRRRVDDRRSRQAHPTGGRRRTDIVLPPISRLIPALVLVAVSLADLAVAQATGTKGWSLLLIAAAFPIAAYDLVNPWRWKWHLGVVWFAVGVYVTATGVHVAMMLTG
jgi:hypothetical protein